MIDTTLKRSGAPAQVRIENSHTHESVEIYITIFEIHGNAINCTAYREMVTPDWGRGSPTINSTEDYIEIEFGCEYYKPNRIKRLIAYILTYSDIYIAGVVNGDSIALQLEKEVETMEMFSN